MTANILHPATYRDAKVNGQSESRMGMDRAPALESSNAISALRYWQPAAGEQVSGFLDWHCGLDACIWLAGYWPDMPMSCRWIGRL